MIEVASNGITFISDLMKTSQLVQMFKGGSMHAHHAHTHNMVIP